MSALLMMAWLAAAPAGPGAQAPSPVKEVDVTFQRTSASWGRVTLRAPTTGWVLVGFNATPGLAGAWLIMARVDARGGLEVEEHRARPPRHARWVEATATPHVRDVKGQESDGVTEVSFSLPLLKSVGAPYDIGVDAVERIVAYSVSDDWQHHSRRRAHAFGRVPWRAPTEAGAADAGATRR